MTGWVECSRDSADSTATSRLTKHTVSVSPSITTWLLAAVLKPRCMERNEYCSPSMPLRPIDELCRLQACWRPAATNPWAGQLPAQRARPRLRTNDTDTTPVLNWRASRNARAGPAGLNRCFAAVPRNAKGPRQLLHAAVSPVQTPIGRAVAPG